MERKVEAGDQEQKESRRGFEESHRRVFTKNRAKEIEQCSKLKVSSLHKSCCIWYSRGGVTGKLLFSKETRAVMIT